MCQDEFDDVYGEDIEHPNLRKDSNNGPDKN